MTFNIDQLKKKIIYRSNYRGTKEMDKLLGAFTKKYINQLNQDELIDLEKLLDIDDTSLYNFFNGIVYFFAGFYFYLWDIINTVKFIVQDLSALAKQKDG